MAKDLVQKHIQEAYDIQYRYYCMMHTGYRRVDAEVKKLESRVLTDHPSLSLIEFEKAVRYKQEAIAKWRKAKLYWKSLKKEAYERDGK